MHKNSYYDKEAVQFDLLPSLSLFSWLYCHGQTQAASNASWTNGNYTHLIATVIWISNPLIEMSIVLLYSNGCPGYKCFDIVSGECSYTSDSDPSHTEAVSETVSKGTVTVTSAQGG